MCTAIELARLLACRRGRPSAAPQVRSACQHTHAQNAPASVQGTLVDGMWMRQAVRGARPSLLLHCTPVATLRMDDLQLGAAYARHRCGLGRCWLGRCWPGMASGQESLMARDRCYPGTAAVLGVLCPACCSAACERAVCRGSMNSGIREWEVCQRETYGS